VEIELIVQASEDGSVQEARCNLDRRIVVGRDPESPVQIQGPGISREHFALEEQDGRALIFDLSSNGTSVNGNRLEKGRPREIRHGDLIEIPGYQIDFKITGAVEMAPFPDMLPDRPPAIVEEAPPEKKSFLAPVTAFIGEMSFLEKLMIIVAMISFWLGLYYYTA
jgi:predicted component of type VI protein secretion system